jgi:hypothetical protein
MTTAYEAAMAARDAAKDAEAAFLRLRRATGKEDRKRAKLLAPELLTVVCEHQRTILTVCQFEGYQIIDATFLGRVVQPGTPFYQAEEGYVSGAGDPAPDEGKVARYRDCAILPKAGIFADATITTADNFEIKTSTTYLVGTHPGCCVAEIPLPWLREKLANPPASRRSVAP